MESKLKSIFTDDMEHCAICKRSPVQMHHVIFGSSNRKNSDADGYIVPLCLEHHLGNNGVHHNHTLDLIFKCAAQTHYEQTHTREDFIQRYGRSFL